MDLGISHDLQLLVICLLAGFTAIALFLLVYVLVGGRAHARTHRRRHF